MNPSVTHVLITGCSTGIGRALALAFRERGCTVYATARRPEQLDALAAQGIRPLRLDVTDPASIDALRAGLAAENIPVDILVNNAGYGAMGPLSELPEDELRRQFDTNVIGLIGVSNAVIPIMRQRRSGCIVNIGSVSGVLVTPFAGAYCASKAAVHALSDAMRMELAPFGIEVMTVQPGAIRSDFGATASRGVEDRGHDASPYAPIADAIAARANASQQHSTSAEAFADRLCRAVLADRRPAQLRIGSGSTLLPALRRWIPRSLLDRLLSKRFGLDRLRR